MGTVQPSSAAAGPPTRLRAALLAAAAATAAFCAGDAVARSFPFGPRTRDVNDLGNQFLPFHAHLWDLLHGRADGGVLLNWQSGYGTSFLPDLGTYVSSPFALLVGLFPRDRIDVAVYVVTVLKIGVAAAAMACLLLMLRPGLWWAAGLLGASYAMCGWTVSMASYNTMWLDGLIAFPAFCMVAEWARTGRRPVVSVLVVALGWTANFYTAYMATLGAALVLVARLLAEQGTGRRQWLAAVGRAALWATLGVALTAPLLLTIVKATQAAYPGRTSAFVAAPWSDVFAQLLPGTFSGGSPALYLNSAALLLALLLPFQKAVPGRARAVWTGVALMTLLSFQWRPTHLLWHAFATPNGDHYRQTFVLSGVMVIAAWLSVAYGLPKLREIVWGAGVMGALAVVATAAHSGVTGRGTYPLFGVGLVLAVGALLVLGRGEAVRSRMLVVAAVTALVGAQFAQSALSDAWSDRQRLEQLDDYAPWGERQASEASVIAAADAWPAYRTEPGQEPTVSNDPMMVGGQGAAYYSSLTPAVWTRTLAALGGGWESRGRSLQGPDNPVTDVIFSVGARAHQQPDPHQRGNPPAYAPSTVTRQEVPPLVTVHAAQHPDAYGASPYLNQELLLGHQVYDKPRAVVLEDGNGARIVPRGSQFRVRGGAAAGPGDEYTLAATCPAGDQVYLYLPGLHSSVRLPGGATLPFTGGLPYRLAAVERVAVAPLNGRVVLALRAFESGTVSTQAVGCLNTGKLADAERRIDAAAATSERVTADGISAQLPPGSRGYAVVAAPAIDGWRCSAGGGGAHAGRSWLGLLAVKLPADGRATSVSCSFTPPGLRQGEAVTGVALAGVAGMLGYGWWRRRRGAAGGGPGERGGRGGGPGEPLIEAEATAEG